MNRKQAEAEARVDALLYNFGGTYAAIARATGMCSASLSRWRRRLSTPRDLSLASLREFT